MYRQMGRPTGLQAKANFRGQPNFPAILAWACFGTYKVSGMGGTWIATRVMFYYVAA